MSDDEAMIDEGEVDEHAADDEHDGDDDADETSSTPKGKGASASKKVAAAASATKGAKKASPNKRKEPPASSATGSAPKKAKPITGDAKDAVRTYMRQQNRPYTALVVYENLHHQIKKPTLIKYMDELVEEGDLQEKMFGKTKLYMAKQSDSDAVTPEEMDALQAKEARIREQVAEQKAKNAKLDAQIRALQNEPSDEELAKQLAQYKKQIDALNSKLARFKNDKNLVTKDKMNEAQRDFNECFKQWRLRKRAAEDMVSQMCGDEGNPKDVFERFKLESDEDAGEKLADWKDLVKEIKK